MIAWATSDGILLGHSKGTSESKADFCKELAQATPSPTYM